MNNILRLVKSIDKEKFKFTLAGISYHDFDHLYINYETGSEVSFNSKMMFEALGGSPDVYRIKYLDNKKSFYKYDDITDAYTHHEVKFRDDRLILIYSKKFHGTWELLFRKEEIEKEEIENYIMNTYFAKESVIVPILPNFS